VEPGGRQGPTHQQLDIFDNDAAAVEGVAKKSIVPSEVVIFVAYPGGAS
jgi:hypothetical protein